MFQEWACQAGQTAVGNTGLTRRRSRGIKVRQLHILEQKEGWVWPMEHIDEVSEEPGQRIAVTAVKDSRVQVAFQEKETGIWKTRRECTGWAGRNGYGKREEGDGRTPVGRLSFLYAFGTCPSPGTQFPYRRMDASHYLVDDAASGYYNRIVSCRDVPVDWRSAEHMADMGRAYCYGLATDYNKERVPGRGSGIFLHCEEGRPTAGCVSVPREMMVWLLQNMGTDCYMVIDFPGGKCYT